MRRSIVLGERRIDYFHEPVARHKGVSLLINPQKGLLVRTGKGAGPRMIAETLRLRADWILTNLDKLAALGLPPTPREYGEGTVLPLQDQQLTLRLLMSSGGKAWISCRENQLTAGVPHEFDLTERRFILLELLKSWYLTQARRILPGRVEHFCSRLGLAVPAVKFSRQAQSRWGSCNSAGVIRLSWRLMLMPAYLSDYVAAHEVCHLRHLNHSPAFWQLLEGLLPGAHELRGVLNRQGPFYDLY
ncbi:MAG: M48 family metallopeptidase [Desulfarculales bacterium]|nr:M48 family metallopeptidase [Desulfarculales bacterium]